MYSYDPKLLRKLAATYRNRAAVEPDRARTFLEIADDMEAHARLIEANTNAAYAASQSRPTSGSH